MSDNSWQIISKIRELNSIQDPYWISYTLFSWQWWVGIFLTIAPWVLWIIVRKKDSTNRLLFVSLFVILFTSYLDFLGCEMTLWYYEYKALPTIPSYIPWDFSMFPVTIMLLLQYKPNYNPFIKGACFGVFAAFIFEPIFAMLHLYTPIKWKFIYSFPIYIMLYLISHFLSRRRNFGPL